MLTKEQVLEAVREGRESGAFVDRRDYARLCDFFPAEEWHHFGFEPKSGGEPPGPKPWMMETILAQLRKDVAFGFEKALDQRGISASLMYEVVKMWLWVLEEDELAESCSYAMYGLPLLKAVALKYGFENLIGEDSGSEVEYDG